MGYSIVMNSGMFSPNHQKNNYITKKLLLGCCMNGEEIMWPGPKLCGKDKKEVADIKNDTATQLEVTVTLQTVGLNDV